MTDLKVRRFSLCLVICWCRKKKWINESGINFVWQIKLITLTQSACCIWWVLQSRDVIYNLGMKQAPPKFVQKLLYFDQKNRSMNIGTTIQIFGGVITGTKEPRQWGSALCVKGVRWMRIIILNVIRSLRNTQKTPGPVTKCICSYLVAWSCFFSTKSTP